MRHKYRKKKYCLLLGLFILSWSISNVPLKAAADEIHDENGTDFILVLDCSGSMMSSDKEQLSISAAQRFVDMLPMENARVGIVGFGPDWGDESYTYEKNGNQETFTKIVYPLNNTADMLTQQEEAKLAIAEVESHRGDNPEATYTTVGYALAAANSMLEQGDTADGQACIVLMSDGRLSDVGGIHEEQDGSDLYKSDPSESMINSHSLDETLNNLASHDWPVYSMELAFDLENNNSWQVPVGLYQMQRIADETGGEKIRVFNNQDVKRAFDSIFARFFEVADDTGTAGPTTISIGDNGFANFTVPVEEMTAEMNISITGERISEVNAVELTTPDGDTKKYTGSDKTDTRIITFNKDSYIMIKLLQPQEGDWIVTVYGTGGVELEVDAIPMREVMLQLTTNWDTNEMALKGSQVECTAKFAYNNQSISSEFFYKEYPAVLEIENTGEKIEMTPSNDNYVATLPLNQTGSYTVRAYVESSHFRNERKISNTLTFNVENSEPVQSSDMEDISLKFNESMEFDCNQYFRDPDGDVLIYDASVDQTSGIRTSVKDNILTVTAGEKAGDVPIRVTANDGSLKEPLEQIFVVHMVNQPLVGKGRDTIHVNVNYNAEHMPGFLRKLFGIEEGAAEVIDPREYFEDPDGLPIRYELLNVPKDDFVTVSDVDGVIEITGHAKGEASFQLIGIDPSDSTVTVSKDVIIKSVSTGGYIWSKCGILFVFAGIIVAASVFLLLAMMPKKGIYGIWDVYVNGGRKKNLANFQQITSSIKKCRLDEMLEYLGIAEKIGQTDIQIKNGNAFSKTVIFTGLKDAKEVVYNDCKHDQTDDVISKAKVKKGTSIQIKFKSAEVKFERKA